MIRAERGALLRAVTAEALREADREVVRTPLTRRSDVRFRGQTGKHFPILSFTGFDPNRTMQALICCAARTTSRSASRSALASARGRARRSARIISSGAGPQRNSHAADAPHQRAFEREAYRNFWRPGFDTSRKSLLWPKARDVAL